LWIAHVGGVGRGERDYARYSYRRPRRPGGGLGRRSGDI